MSLTDEQKRKIEEEEQYRAELRNTPHQKPKKKGMGIVKWLLIILIGNPFAIAILVNIGSSSSTSTTSSPTPTIQQSELKGTVNFDGQLFHVINEEERQWTNCWMTLNKDYNYPPDISATRYDVEPMDTYTISPTDVTLKDGTRFNPFTIKPSNVSLSCDEGFGYWTW